MYHGLRLLKYSQLTKSRLKSDHSQTITFRAECHCIILIWVVDCSIVACSNLHSWSPEMSSKGSRYYSNVSLYFCNYFLWKKYSQVWPLKQIIQNHQRLTALSPVEKSTQIFAKAISVFIIANWTLQLSLLYVTE